MRSGKGSVRVSEERPCAAAVMTVIPLAPGPPPPRAVTRARIQTLAPPARAGAGPDTGRILLSDSWRRSGIDRLGVALGF